MNKLKSILFTLFTVCIILSCAFLPNIISYAFDKKPEPTVSYRDISTIQIDQKIELSILGKISLMLRTEGIIVSEENTATPTEKLLSTVHSALQPYYDTGLICELSSDAHIDSTAYFLYDTYNPMLNSVLWYICISYENDGSHVINLIIDDETHTVLAIEYTTTCLLTDYEAASELLYRFIDIYTAGLGIAAEDIVNEENESVPTRDEYTSVTQIFRDEEHGEISVDFSLDSHGFTTNLFI